MNTQNKAKFPSFISNYLLPCDSTLTKIGAEAMHTNSRLSLNRKCATCPLFLPLQAGTRWSTDVGWVILDYVDDHPKDES